MSGEPDNLVLVHLREMRAEMNARFGEMDKRFERVEQRLDAMQRQGLDALRGFIGFRGRSDRAFGGVEQQLELLELRVTALEKSPR